MPGAHEDPVPRSWLVVASHTRGELVYEAGRRHRNRDGSVKTIKRRLGPAWLEQDGADYRRRRGRVKSGFLDEHAAVVAKDALVREVERDLERREVQADRAVNAPVTFREAALAYLDWLERVKGAKPSTLQDHGYLLAEPARSVVALAGRFAARSCRRSVTAPPRESRHGKSIACLMGSLAPVRLLARSISTASSSVRLQLCVVVGDFRARREPRSKRRSAPGA